MTREPFAYRGRVTELFDTGKLSSELGVPRLNPSTDRVMICGSPDMMKDACALTAMLEAL